MMLKNRLFVLIFTMFCCNLFCLSLSKANSLKSIKNIFGKQQSCLSTDLFKAEWDCNGNSFKTKLCAFGENKKISLIYSIIDDLNECARLDNVCINVSIKINHLKTELGNDLSNSIKKCLGITETETGIEALNDINDDIQNVDNYKNDIQKLYKYKYCLEGSETSETTDDILYIDSDVKEKEGFLLLLYKQLYYELTVLSNLIYVNENENHGKYEYVKNQILNLADRILYKENNQGLLDIYAELDKIDTAKLLSYTSVLMEIKDNRLINVEKINIFREIIKEQITDLEKAKINDCDDDGAISQRDNKLKNKYCSSGNNIIKQKYVEINNLIDNLEVLKVTSTESEENANNNIYYIESYITVMQNGINDIKTEIVNLKNLVNQYSSDLMMNVNDCFGQYINTDTIIKNFETLDFYFNADNNVNSLVKYYRYLKELNTIFGGSTVYTKEKVNAEYAKFDKKLRTMLNSQEFFVNFLNYNSSFVNLIRSEENKVAEIFKQELFSEEIRAVVYDNAIIETMCYIMDLVTGNIGRSIIALSLIITAFMWLQGKIEPKELFSFVAAITIMYESLSIANLIARNNYSCGLAKSLEYIERTDNVDKCEDGFIWSINTNKCIAKSCYNPTMENVIFYSNYAFYKGNSVLGECVNGYEGEVNAKCIFTNEELNWEYTGGCEKIHCYTQPSYEGVSFDISSNEIIAFDYQEKVSGKCKKGYKGEGYTATCTGKNKWSYSGNCEPIYCPALNRTIDGTTKQASWPATRANSVGYGTCFSPYVNTYFDDYDLNPNSSRSVSFAFCDENGQWDFQSEKNQELLKSIYYATTKTSRNAKKEEFQRANKGSKYSKYLCEISKCERINITNSKNGNAIWPESDIGDENIVGTCGRGYYYNEGVEKTINSVETYNLTNQYLTDAEQSEIDKYFKRDFKDIIANLTDEIKKKYNLNEVENLTDTKKKEIIKNLKIEEITAKMQSKSKDTILGKCQANGEIASNNNAICYVRKCPAVTVGDENSNYASWPETDALTLIEYNESSKDGFGCINGYGGSHNAYCDEFGTWHFDSYNDGYKTVKLESCILNACNENITSSLRDNNGFSIVGFWDNKIKWKDTDEENATIKLIKDFKDREQGRTIEIYCTDNSEVYNYDGKNENFSKNSDGVSYIKATCSNKNEWITNGKCTYKPCEAIEEKNANLDTSWAYFKEKSYPESNLNWIGSCHHYFSNEEKTFKSMLEKRNFESVVDLKGEFFSFVDIINSLKSGQIISGSDASCQFDTEKDKSILSIAKNHCKIPVVFADLYKEKGVLKFFNVNEPIECSKKNFDFMADADDNSFVCIMFTSLFGNYNYSGTRDNKSYKILAVEGETINPMGVIDIKTFEEKTFNQTKNCHPFTVEMDINKNVTHLTFGDNTEQYIYKSSLYSDAGLIKNDTKTATYPNACEAGYVGNPVVKCNIGIWEPTEEKCKPGCYISAITSDIKNDNFQDILNKIDVTNLFVDTVKNGKFLTKLSEVFVYDGTYIKIPLNGCKDGYAGIPIVKCNGTKWKWETESNTNNYCYKGACYFSTYANAEGTSGWEILNDLNDFSNTGKNAIVKDNEYMIANCNDRMVSNMDNNFTNSTINSIEQQKYIITQCQNGIIKPYSNSGTSCVSGCVYGDKTKGWNDSMFSGTDADSAYSIFKEIGGTTGIFSVRGATNSVIQRNCKANYSAAEITINGYSCDSSLSTQPVVQCENGEWKQYANGGKHCYTCGIVVQYYSPRDETLFKEKTLKEGDTVVCDSDSFGGDPDIGVKKLCRIKGSDKYFGYEGDGETYTVNDKLFTRQSPACHIAYVSENIKSKSSLLSDYTKAGGETKLYDGTIVYSIGNNYGLRKNGEKYIIRCAGGYAGAPEIVCNNGKWAWNPVKDTDNQCYEGGCDVSTYHTDGGYYLSSKGWGLETKSCSVERDTTRKIIPNGSWASAECENKYISNVDNPVCDETTRIERQKSVFGKCVNGNIEHKPTGSSQHGDACVPGCVYGDTSMGWTADMMQDTTGDYKQYNAKVWGKANVGKYAVRKDDSNDSDSILIYKNCRFGYAPGGRGSIDRGYPIVKCHYDSGEWSRYKISGSYVYMRCMLLSGCTEFVYQSNGANNNQGLVAPANGLRNLKIQVWGAEGGQGLEWKSDGKHYYGGGGGYGGYAYGELSELPAGEKINVITGQYGGVTRAHMYLNTEADGAGKGGRTNSGVCGNSRGRGGNGGGGSKVWYGNKILQAGGGGGGCEHSGQNGGYGGGANQNGERGAGSGGGYPGTLTAAGGATNPARTGKGNGSNGGHAGNTDSNNSGDRSTDKGNWCGGGGGGGYYGGGAGEWGKTVYGGGGGGSGYAVGFDNIDGANGVQRANGLVRICWGNSTACDGGSGSGKVSKCEGSKYALNGNSNILRVNYGDGGNWFGEQSYKYGTVLTNGCSNTTYREVYLNQPKWCCMPNGLAYAPEGDSPFYVY